MNRPLATTQLAGLLAGFLSASSLAGTAGADEAIARFESAPNLWEQLDAADEVARVTTPDDIRRLDPGLGNRAMHTRGNYAYLFAKTGDQHGFDVLVAMLADYSDARVVEHTILNPMPAEQKRAGELATQIVSDRYYAVHLFGRLRDARAADVLIPLLDDETINYNVAWALGELGSPKVVPALIGALSDKDALVRIGAIGALQKLQAKEAMPDIAKLFGDNALPTAGERVPVGEVARKAVASLSASR